MRSSTCLAAWILVATLSATAPAAAQEGLTLSRRERAYVERLGERFGEVAIADKSRFTIAADGVVTDVTDAPSAATSPGASEATSLLVRAGDTTIGRYKFDSPEQAQQEAVRVLEDPEGGREPLVGEVRGDQLLVLTGPAAKDPAAAREALDAAWQGLPAASRPDGTFALLGPHDVVLTTRLQEGPLRAAIDQVLAETRELEGRPGVTLTGTDAGQVKLESGFEAGFQAGEDGATLWTGQGPVRARQAREYLEQVAPPRSGSVTEGARRVIDRLFGE